MRYVLLSGDAGFPLVNLPDPGALDLDDLGSTAVGWWRLGA